MAEIRNEHQTEKISGILIALILCMSILTRLLGLVVRIPYNIVLMEILITLALILMNGNRILLTNPFIILLLAVAGIFGYTAILSGIRGIYVQRLLHFVMYGFFPAFCFQYRFDVRSFRRTLLFCGIPFLVYLYGYAVRWLSTGAMAIDETMDLSYTALIIAFAAIWTIEEKDSILCKLIALSAVFLIVYFMLIYSANRGAFVALAGFIVLTALRMIKRPGLRWLALLAVSCLGVLVFVHLAPILDAVYEFASEQGVTVKALNKMIQELAEGYGADSGRTKHYLSAYQMMKDNLFMPTGVGSFYLASGTEYPHNMIVEVGLEMGIGAAVFCLYLIVKALRHILFGEADFSHICSFLFCLSIPRLMVSSTLWENFFFWALIIALFVQKDKDFQEGYE